MRQLIKEIDQQAAKIKFEAPHQNNKTFQFRVRVIKMLFFKICLFVNFQIALLPLRVNVEDFPVSKSFYYYLCCFAFQCYTNEESFYTTSVYFECMRNATVASKRFFELAIVYEQLKTFIFHYTAYNTGDALKRTLLLLQLQSSPKCYNYYAGVGSISKYRSTYCRERELNCF